MAQRGRRWRRRATILGGTAVALAMHSLAPAATFDTAHVNLDLAVSSDYVVYGVTRSQGKPSLQAQLAWSGETGWFAGTWLASVDTNEGPGPNREIDVFLGRRWILSRDWAARADLTRYIFQPGAMNVRYNYTELRSALSYRNAFDVAVAWSPDYSGASWYGAASDRSMLTYEASAHFPATPWLGLNAGLGRRDLEEVFGASYWYWSAGTEATFRRFSVALTYIGTSARARELFTTEYAGNRVVATVGVRLQ